MEAYIAALCLVPLQHSQQLSLSVHPLSLSSCRTLIFLLSLSFRRHYAGWLKKNKFVEEWNGRREITEKSFEAKPDNLHMFLLWGIGAPAGVYFWSRSELTAKGDRRYENVI